MKKGEIIPVKIEKFALGGQGLAFVENPGHDGIPTRRVPVFVDDICVGDEADVRIITKKNSFAEGRVQKVTQESNERVAARCQHFGVCGGCTWQFLPYEKQLKWKEQLVRETLQHVGGLSDEVLNSVFQPACGCDDPWFYRNKMEWSFSVDRDGAFSGGFHMRHMHYDTVNVQECFLQSEPSVKVFKKVRAYFEAMHSRGVVVPYNSHTGQGLVHSVYVREGKRTGEMMVIVQTTPEKFDVEGFLKVLSEFPAVVSVVRIVVHEQKGTPKRWDVSVLQGEEFYREELWIRDSSDTEIRLQFQVKPQAFFQPNTMMAEKIYGQALQLLQGAFSPEALRKMRAYDLYCGTGTIGIVLSHAVASVVGVELNASAIESAKENAILNHVENIEFHVGDVKKVLDELETTHAADVIVVDPPRNGLEEKVVEHIIRTAPKAIVYVSCSPATLARDVKIFTGNGNGIGYALASARVFDQFPQTAHIETVALLKKVE